MLNVFTIHEFYHNPFNHHSPIFNMHNGIPRYIAVLPMLGLMWMQITYVSRKSSGSPQGTLQNSDVPLVAVGILSKWLKHLCILEYGAWSVGIIEINKISFLVYQSAYTMIIGPVDKCLAIGYGIIHAMNYVSLAIYVYIYIYQCYGRKSKICPNDMVLFSKQLKCRR